jgi:hypothetical protein
MFSSSGNFITGTSIGVGVKVFHFSIVAFSFSSCSFFNDSILIFASPSFSLK